MMLERGKNQKPEDGSKKKNGTQGTLEGTSVCYEEDYHPLHVCAHAYKHTHTQTHTTLYLCNWHQKLKTLHVSLLSY